MRDILLRDTGSPVEEDTLDFSDLAKKMTAQLVPRSAPRPRCWCSSRSSATTRCPRTAPDADVPLRRLHLRHDEEDPAWNSAFPVGEVLRFPPGSPYISGASRRAWPCSSTT